MTVPLLEPNSLTVAFRIGLSSTSTILPVTFTLFCCTIPETSAPEMPPITGEGTKKDKADKAATVMIRYLQPSSVFSFSIRLDFNL